MNYRKREKSQIAPKKFYGNFVLIKWFRSSMNVSTSILLLASNYLKVNISYIKYLIYFSEVYNVQ